jgi:hypothetical protein
MMLEDNSIFNLKVNVIQHILFKWYDMTYLKGKA